MIPLVDVKAQYAPLIPELKERFAEVLESGRFIFGPEVEAFEREAAAYLGVPRALGVANGTDALVLSLEAMGIGRGDEVICPAFTFYATAEAIARVGATPVFADIDPVTLNVDPQDVAARITVRTKAIMPVHLFGRPAPLEELAALELPILEDAAQAFGAPGVATTGRLLHVQLLPDEEPLRARGRRSRSRARTTASPRRSGGFASTARATSRRSSSSATNSRLDAIQAAALRVFLPQLPGWNAPGARRPRATPSSGSATRWSCPLDEPGHVYHMYVVRTHERDRIAAALADGGIASAAYYVTPLHLQPAMAYLGYEPGSLPETERAAAENLALPMWGGIGPAEQERVVSTVRAAVGVAV